MKAILMRTGSGSVSGHTPVLSGSPKISLSCRDSFNGIFSGENNTVYSPKISLHLEINRQTPIRRAFSETDIIRSETDVFSRSMKLSGAGSRSFPEIIPEEEYLSGYDVDDNCRSSTLNYTRIWPDNGIPLEELGLTGGGFGKGRKFGGGNGGGNHKQNGDNGGRRCELSNMGDYYKEMLKSNPSDSLLLRNYGKFLHEVEGDMERAEEYYGRAILESPGDGEVLALYGKLIWDSHKDGEKANAYFDQAVSASPNDCMVLGSYAQFMWEAGENEGEDSELSGHGKAQTPPAAMVAVL